MGNFLSALLGQAQAQAAASPRVVGRPTTDEEEAQTPVQAPPQMGTLQHLMRGGDW